MKAPTLIVVSLLILLLAALVMGAPAWITAALALVVLLYGGVLFSKKDEKVIAPKEGSKVVCWNCKYDNKTGKFICEQCKVRL